MKGLHSFSWSELFDLNWCECEIIIEGFTYFSLFLLTSDALLVKLCRCFLFPQAIYIRILFELAIRDVYLYQEITCVSAWSAWSVSLLG